MSDRAFLNGVSVKPAPDIPSLPRSLPPPFAHFCHGRAPGFLSPGSPVRPCAAAREAFASLPQGVLGSGSSYVVSIHRVLL